MAGFDDQLMQEVEGRAEANSPGQQAIDQLDGAKASEEAEAQAVKSKAAYDASPVATHGPSRDDYDYDAAYAGGANLKPAGEGGGTKLPMRHFKPGRVGVLGYNLQGERTRSIIDDPEGHARAAAIELGRSETNTMDGAPEKDVKHLGLSAYALVAEGGTFEDFNSHTSNNWNLEQKQRAWGAANRAGERVWLENMVINGSLWDPGWPEAAPRPEPIYVKDLPQDQDWMGAAEIVYEALNGHPSELSPEDLSGTAMEIMAGFTWNVAAQAGLAIWAFNQPPEVAKAFLDLMTVYEDVDSWDPVTVANSAFAFIVDPANLIGAGVGGAVLKTSLRASKNIVARKLTEGLLGFAGGAAYGAADATSRQAVDIGAGEREGFDTGEIAADAALEGGLGMAGVGALQRGASVVKNVKEKRAAKKATQ